MVILTTGWLKAATSECYYDGRLGSEASFSKPNVSIPTNRKPAECLCPAKLVAEVCVMWVIVFCALYNRPNSNGKLWPNPRSLKNVKLQVICPLFIAVTWR